MEVADQFDELIDSHRFDRDPFFDRPSHLAFQVLHDYILVHLNVAKNAKFRLYDRLDPKQALHGRCIKAAEDALAMTRAI